MGSARKLDRTIEELEYIATRYCQMKEEVKGLEEALEFHKEILLSAAQEGHNLVGEYELKSTSKTRKSFDIKSAERVLDPNILKPFYTTTSYDELRVKRLSDRT